MKDPLIKLEPGDKIVSANQFRGDIMVVTEQGRIYTIKYEMKNDRVVVREIR